MLAAAAVVVVGVGINQVDLSGAATTAASATPATPAATPRPRTPPERTQPAGGARTPVPPCGWPSDVDRLGVRPKLRRQLRTAHARRDAATAGPRATDELERDAERPGRRRTRVVRDPGGSAPGPAVVAVRYDGERGWLVFRPPEGETQVVDLYLCGQDDPTRSITLPAS